MVELSVTHFLADHGIRNLDVVITGTILVYDWMTIVLFDSGFTYSYLYVNFSLGFYLNCDTFDAPIYLLLLLESLPCVYLFLCVSYEPTNSGRFSHIE